MKSCFFTDQSRITFMLSSCVCLSLYRSLDVKTNRILHDCMLMHSIYFSFFQEKLPIKRHFIDTICKYNSNNEKCDKKPMLIELSIYTNMNMISFYSALKKRLLANYFDSLLLMTINNDLLFISFRLCLCLILLE